MLRDADVGARGRPQVLEERRVVGEELPLLVAAARLRDRVHLVDEVAHNLEEEMPRLVQERREVRVLEERDGELTIGAEPDRAAPPLRRARSSDIYD